MTTIITGFIPWGNHKSKGKMYFSITKQKWVDDIKKLKLRDILPTGTVPIKYPNRTLKHIKIIDGLPDVGVSKIEINMEI